MKKSSASNIGLIVLSLPTVIWYVLFCYLPIFGIIIAFKRYHPVPGKSFIYNLFVNSNWVGLENFRFLFLNPQISAVVRNTLVYNLVFILADTILPVVLAIMLSYIYSKKLSTLAQTISLLPHFLSWVVVSYFLYAFLATDKGLFNRALTALDLEPIKFYQTPSVWPAILIFTHIWKSFGYATVMYMAYITSIDTSLYESATVDGATVFSAIRYITLPLLKPIILIILILNLGGIFNSDFGLFYQATRNSGSIIQVTETIDVYTYKALMEQANYSYSAAASLMQNVIGCIFLVVANAVVKKMNPEGGIV
jgi:putative aldouronate transport system permease protein